MYVSRYTFSRWIRNLISLTFLSSLLSAFGVLWLVVNATNFFSPPAGNVIRGLWWLFLLVGFSYGLFACRPKNRVGCRLQGRDVYIEIVIGDIFKFDGSLIVGCNTTFDTELLPHGLISPMRIQGQFTDKYYDDIHQLDSAIEAQLKNIPCEDINDSRVSKKRLYKIGTVVRVNPKSKNAYLVAMAHINEYGNARGDFEDIKEALAKLWVFIGERGVRENLVMPVLGTGFARISETRQEVIEQTVLSFIAACSERVFCEKMTIVIFYKDAIQYSIDIEKIGKFINHICEYTKYSNNNKKRGTAIE